MTGSGERELISSGYQGSVYKIMAEASGAGGPNPESHYLIIKEAMGMPGIRQLRQAMIRREYAIYRRLEGIAGIPQCYGLQGDNRLLLEFIEGHSLRLSKNELPDRAGFFAELLEILQAVHAAGVAHGDMKRKDNILVTPEGRPYLVDFGSAVPRKDGAFLNRWLFRQACKIDLNAWIKHKYLGRYDEISAADAHLFQPTVIERIARFFRRIWHKLTGRRWRERRRWAKEKKPGDEKPG
jgi:serine/threonine protein kinase